MLPSSSFAEIAKCFATLEASSAAIGAFGSSSHVRRAKRGIIIALKSRKEIKQTTIRDYIIIKPS